MSSPDPAPPPAGVPPSPLWPLAAISLAAVVAYANALTAPFIFDDEPAILENPSIQGWSTAWFPPVNGSSVVGRPLVNLSFAFNYAIGGYAPVGYHLLNLLIHVLAGATLYAIVRRTWWRCASSEMATASAATVVAFGGALWWVVHPLQTESVTCVVQRTESLAGLWLLLVLYAVTRANEEPAARRWPVVAGLAALAGVLTKESTVVAPILAWSYDRAFGSPTWREARRARRGMYAALFATWIPLAWLVIATGGDRGGTSGLTTGTVAPWHYLLTQCEAIVRYLQLAVWPHPLVLDYGIGIHREWQAVMPQGMLLVALAAGGAWLWWRRPRWGFFAVWFFATLAPSSSVVPLATQPIAEHRMYLPLAALTTLAVIGLHAAARSRRVAVLAFALVGALLAGLTAWRNHDYRSAIAIWTDTVDKVSDNARARNQLGRALREAGRRDDAAVQFEAALRLDPTLADAHYNVGLDREERGERTAAEEHYRAAVQLHPRHAQARLNLAALLNDAGRWSEAIAFSEESVRLRPDDAALHLNLGAALLGAGLPRDALAPLQRAVTLAPDDPRAHGNLANALALTDRFDEAADHYENALRLQPDYARAHENYALLLLHLGRAADAVSHLEAALRLEPGNDRLRAHLDHARAAASSPQ